MLNKMKMKADKWRGFGQKGVSLLFGLVLCLTAVILGNESSKAQLPNDISAEIKEMAAVYQEKKINIEEWKLYGRINVYKIRDLVAFQKEVNELKQKMGHLNWTVMIEEDQWKAVGTSFNDHLRQEETLQLITTHTKKSPTSYLLYEVTGYGWKEKSAEKIINNFQSNLAKFSHEDAETFACMTGVSHDKIEGVLQKLSSELLDAFQANVIEELNEDTFVSISAYTELWNKVLPTHHGKMNLQIGLRTQGMGDKTTVIVGTPIITVEY